MADGKPVTEKTTSRKTTKTATKVRGVVKEMYQRAHQAKAEGIPVTYAMVGSRFDEILHAFGIVPIWTENYAGLCAAKRAAESYLVRAEDDGYSNVICSYARTGLGFDSIRCSLGSTPEGAPDGGMAYPDFLLGSSSGCDPRFKWYQALGRYMDVPTYNIDIPTPPVHADLKAMEGYYVRYLLEEFKGLVAFLEYHTKRKLDGAKIEEAIAVGQQVYQLWYDCDMLRKAIPSPMLSQDHFSIMVPAKFRLCDPVTIDFYRELYAELAERVANGVGAIPNEKYRLLWAGGLPPWHTMWIFNYFEDFGAAFVIERVYRRQDPVEIPNAISDPLEKLAYATFHAITQKFDRAKVRSGSQDVQYIQDLIEDYRVEGMVMHASKSCRASTLGQLYAKQVIQENVDIPFLQLQSDMIDVRDYSDAQWKSSIDAFLEMVGRRKGALRA